MKDIVKETKKEAVTVWSCKVARQLLKMGYQIIDIKPDRNDKKRTVFMFRNENNIVAAIESCY